MPDASDEPPADANRPETEENVRRKALGRDFQDVIAYHRRWLKARNLLRPWLILGAAPGPTIPATLPADTAFAYVKYAGHSARKLGLPAADLTFLLGKTEPQQVAGLDVGHILRMRRKLSAGTRLARLLRSSVMRECEISHGERDRFILYSLGSLFAGPHEARPSNGVSLIAYAIAVGVPRIIIAGISLDSDGYEYDPNARTRRHLDEDRRALTAAAERHPQQVTTSEAGLHGHTGLPLFAP